MKNPLVSVLMPVYNAEKYIKESIESILDQTYPDFLFYIVNDGSTDDSEKIILSYKDNRIIYIKNEFNKGLIYSLNKGISLIESKYLVRMDADDISLPERIQKQVEFMEKNPEIWVAGTQIQYFGNVNNQSDFPLNHDLIKAFLLFGSSIVHPSVILRLEKIKSNKLFYDANFLHNEDYELWTRIAKLGKLANLNNVLLKYRMEGQNISINNWNTREERLSKIYSNLLSELGKDPAEGNLKYHIELSGNSSEVADIRKLKKYSDNLIYINQEKLIYNPESLQTVIDLNWRKLFFKITTPDIGKAFEYWKVTKNISWLQIKYLLGMYRAKIFKIKQ